MILQTCSAPGTSASFNLIAPPTGRLAFSAKFANGAQAFYFLDDGVQSEWGVGVLTTGSPDSFSRNTVIGNSANTFVRLNFAGTARIYNALPAENTVYKSSAGVVTVPQLSVVEPGVGVNTLGIFANASTNGANLLLSGNGVTTPNKWLRVNNGVFAIVNSAYAGVPLTLTDAGALSVTGPINAPSIALTGAVTAASLALTGAITGATTITASGVVKAASFTMNNSTDFGALDSGGVARGVWQYDGSNNVTFRTGTSGTWRIVNNSFTTQLLSVDNTGNVVIAGNFTAIGSGVFGPVSTSNIGATIGSVGGVVMTGGGSISAGPISCGTVNASTTVVGGGGLNVTGASTGSVSGWAMSPGGTFAFAGSVSLAIQTSNYIQAGSFAASSDARLKTEDRLITAAEAERFIRQVPGRIYRKNGSWEAGFFAQDVLAAECNEILTLSDNENLPAEVNGHTGPEGQQWNLGPPDAYLATALASVMDKLDAALDRIALLEGTINV